MWRSEKEYVVGMVPLCLFLLSLTGCVTPEPHDPNTDPEDDTGAPVDTASPAVEDPTHDQHIQPIWTTKCGDCHTVYNEGSLRLLDAYDRIVGVPSEDVSVLNLIQPFEPESSYLWHKVEGTHLSVGGQGSTMPTGSLVLEDHERQTLENWILDGAPR